MTVFVDPHSNVMHTVARARGGVGPHWGFTHAARARGAGCTLAGRGPGWGFTVPRWGFTVPRWGG